MKGKRKKRIREPQKTQNAQKKNKRREFLAKLAEDAKEELKKN